MAVDEKDRAILNLMIQGPFITQKEIAAELGVTPPAVYSRIQKMQGQGILQGFSPIIALDKIGYDITAVVHIKIKNGKMEEAAEKLAKDPKVCSVFDVSGEYDMMAIAKFYNTKELDRWDKKLLKDTELIERINTSIVFTAKKESTNVNKIE